MDRCDTQSLTATDQDLDQAAMLLQAGKLVAFPTETVYGLGADATNGEAVAAIYAAKGRPQFNPLISHVATLEMAERLAEFNDTARALVQKFWPGPLTLILPKTAHCPVSELACAGLDTIAIRCPDHSLALGLIARADRPIAAPSANPSGGISPTSAAHVRDGLNGQIEAILDGGPCDFGVESTILDLTRAPTLLRPGGLTSETLEAVLGTPLQNPPKSDKITAPGQTASHYAPNTKLILNQTTCPTNALWLGFGPMPKNTNGLTLSQTSNLKEAAANLFAHLRKLDAQAASKNIKTIAAAPIPNTGLGLAINDRLTRAAAPKTNSFF